MRLACKPIARLSSGYPRLLYGDGVADGAINPDAKGSGGLLTSWTGPSLDQVMRVDAIILTAVAVPECPDGVPRSVHTMSYDSLAHIDRACTPTAIYMDRACTSTAIHMDRACAPTAIHHNNPCFTAGH